MTTTKSTTRIESMDDELRVVFTDMQSLSSAHDGVSMFGRIAERDDELTDVECEVLESLYATPAYDGGTAVRVATAKQSDSVQPIQVSAENLLYYTAEVDEREPTDAEQAVYEDSFHSAPSPVYELSLPPIEAFQDPMEYEMFESPIESISERERIGQLFQEKIEYGKWLHLKTSYVGAATNLPAEWDADFEDKPKSQLSEGAKMKYYTQRDSWEDVFKLSYVEFIATRLYLLDRLEPKLEPHELVALELVDEAEDETYCQYCGKIDTASNFLVIDDNLDRTKRVCEFCAENWSEFADERIVAAKDERAKEDGGQRRITSEYDN